MKEQPFVFTRREFVQTLAIAGLGATMPSFLTSTASAAPSAAIPGFKDDRILVVVQLGGGNDGLNTIVPHGNDEYFKARKNISLEKKSLLRLNDDLAMHERMTELMNLYDNGGLAIVNGVGYPNPNRSHFRSMEIWQTGVDSDRYSHTGWIGRYFDNCCSGAPDPLAGVTIGNELPQAFTSQKGAGVSFNDPNQFRWLSGDVGNTRKAFDRLNGVNSSHGDETTIDFLRHHTANAVIGSDRVIAASKTKRKTVKYPGSQLSNQLRTVATMIAANLPTRIYYTSISGFDTHANQAGGHANLLGQFSGALSAFLKDLKASGAEDRVMVVAFSEFGRRVGENASRGTDHGTAGPMFLAGAGVKPGIHGKYPSLTDLDEGDLKHSMDFRCIYGEILDSWFEVDQSVVLGRKFKHAGVVG